MAKIIETDYELYPYSINIHAKMSDETENVVLIPFSEIVAIKYCSRIDEDGDSTVTLFHRESGTPLLHKDIESCLKTFYEIKKAFNKFLEKAYAN